MRKYYNEKRFSITDDLCITCKTQNTSYGFRHVAELARNYGTPEKYKVCYYNRTWEAYEYESILNNVLDGSGILKWEEKEILEHKIKNEFEPEAGFGCIAMIAKMGDLLTDNQKDANDWKARMLKAGLENQGLMMPDDWHELSEKEKENRLNEVIELLAQ